MSSTRLPFGGFEQVRPTGSAIRTVFTRAVEDSRGDLWFGSYSGLFRLSGGKWFQYRQTDGLAANPISDLTNSPDGDVLATYVQDPRIDRIRAAGERVHVEYVDRAQGLEPDRVYGVRFDREGRMWAMTDHGAALRDGGKWVHFDRSDGLISDDCNTFLAAADSSVWIGTGRGFSHMLHPRVPAARTAPSVTFSEVRLGGRVVDSSGLLVERQSESLTVKLSTLNTQHVEPGARIADTVSLPMHRAERAVERGRSIRGEPGLSAGGTVSARGAGTLAGRAMGTGGHARSEGSRTLV